MGDNARKRNRFCTIMSEKRTGNIAFDVCMELIGMIIEIVISIF